MRGVLAQLLALLEIEIGGFGVHWPEANIEPGRAPGGGGDSAARHDDVRRILGGQRPHEDRTALEFEPLAAQRAQDDLDPGVEPLGAILGGGLEHGKFAWHIARAEDHPAAPLRDQIENGDLFGNDHRIVQRQDHRAEAEVNLAGDGSHGGGQCEGLGQIAIVGAVVLHQVDAGDADPVSKGCHFNRRLVERGARRAPIGRAHVEGDGDVDLFHG